MESSKPRVLVLAGPVTRSTTAMHELSRQFEVDVFEDVDKAVEALRTHTYHAIFADVGDFLPLERELVSERSTMVLNTIGEGVCVIDADGRCAFSNAKMRSFQPEVFEKIRQITLQARAVLETQKGGHSDPSQVRSKKFTVQHADRYFELLCSPVFDQQGNVRQVVTIAWDATSGRRLQQKIDAIDASGRELARIESDAISKLQPSQRLELLRDKIIRYSKDLMHFDHFAIRLIDKRTNKLEVVIAEGLPPEALDVDLYAQPEGNGISGYVASTRRSYICHDTEKDSRYVQGLQHCKSSLTVPLLLYDKVLGVYNVESQTVGAFNEDDRQFAEIFGRYVAVALHMLDLLVVERFTTSGQMADNVFQEMSQPLADIETETQTLIEEYIGDDTMRGRLNRILEQVQMIRQSVKNVATGPKHVLGGDEKTQDLDPEALAGKSILVADDEINIRRTIGGVFRQMGATVTLCKDGYEAINMIEQRPFDLVLSDIRMPYRTGYEIFAAVQRNHPQVPVILMTGFGYDPHHSIVRASQEGMSSVLFKPFRIEQLLEDVFKALGLPIPAICGKPATQPGEA
ncbi:MAG: response regulator [Phycisphaeraceae bacterium]|nr:response regulator [Phycisphaeraceae bacterium]